MCGVEANMAYHVHFDLAHMTQAVFVRALSWKAVISIHSVIVHPQEMGSQLGPRGRWTPTRLPGVAFSGHVEGTMGPHCSIEEWGTTVNKYMVVYRGERGKMLHVLWRKVDLKR